MYIRALEVPQKSTDVLYFLYNNAGYCLNQLGQYKDSERYCNAAIGINPGRHNAHKNLGIALQNRGKHVDAAKSYLRAVKLAPEDPHALDLLKILVTSHREAFKELSWLLAQFYDFCEAEREIERGFRLQ